MSKIHNNLDVSSEDKERKLMYCHSNSILPHSGTIEYTPHFDHFQAENRGRIDLVNNSQKLLKWRSEKEFKHPNRKSLMLENIKILK